MLLSRRIAMLFALGLAVSTPSVSAKGPPSPKIIFTNNTSVQVGVSTDGGNAMLLAALTSGNLTQFQSLGGEILNAGANHTFTVQVGTYTLVAADLTQSATGVAIVPITQSQTVAGGQTVNVYIKPSGNAAPAQTIVFSSTP